MRFHTILCAAVAANSAFVAADNFDWGKVVHDVAEAVKESGDQAAEAITVGAEHAKEVIDELEKQIETSKGPLTDAIKQAVGEASAALKDAAPKVGDKVKEGAEVVHEAMVEVAEAIKEALNKAADAEDGANAQAPAEMSPEEKKKLEKQMKCAMPCPRIYLPVCGSDGQTHANRCEMKRYACEHDTELEVVHLGKCTGPSKRPDVQTDPCWKACTLENKPVCGSDGKTYLNECFFKIESCHMGGEGMLSIKSQGECDGAEKSPQDCMKACTREYRPLCGTDGKTYSNKCVFEIAQCMLKFDSVDLAVAYAGKCGPGNQPCPMFCTMEYRPVCGTDGQTYGNLCSLRSQACKSPELQLSAAHEGECAEGGSVSAVNGMQYDEGARADIIASAIIVTMFALMATVLGVFAMRRMRASRSQDMGIAPPPYSKLLTEDTEEGDPDELFEAGYGAKHSYTQL